MSSLNKITVLAAIIISSCSYNRYHLITNSSAQIDCPGSSSIIFLENTNREEVYWAAQVFLNKKRAEETNEKYTILRLRDGRTTVIYGVPPEEFYKCLVISIPKNKNSNITTPFSTH